MCVMLALLAMPVNGLRSFVLYRRIKKDLQDDLDHGIPPCRCSTSILFSVDQLILPPSQPPLAVPGSNASLPIWHLRALARRGPSLIPPDDRYDETLRSRTKRSNVWRSSRQCASTGKGAMRSLGGSINVCLKLQMMPERRAL